MPTRRTYGVVDRPVMEMPGVTVIENGCVVATEPSPSVTWRTMPEVVATVVG